MNGFIYGILSIILMAVVYEDFRERTIHWFWIPALFLGAYILGFQQLGAYIFRISIQNSLFITFQIALLTLIFSIKHKKIINLTKSYLGLGDILFFIAITPLFSPIQFISFFVIGMCLTLVASSIYQKIVNPLQTIPLAGILSIFLFFQLWLSAFFQLDRYSDIELLNWLLAIRPF